MPPTPNPSCYYRLTNQYTGPAAPLSVYRDRATGYIYLTTRTATNTPTWNTANNEPTVTPYWQILPVHGSDPPRYHICAEVYEGEDGDDEGWAESSRGSVFLALDVFNEDNTKPHLTKPGHYSGQYWSLTAWPKSGSGSGEDDEGGENGTLSDVMLRNDYSGEELHLDTYSDTKQGFLGEGDHTGQHWVLEKVEKKGRVLAGKAGLMEREEIKHKRFAVSAPQRFVDPGITVGLFAFGVGFGAAVVVAMAWVELLPLMLVIGLSLAAGAWLGMTSPR